MLDLIARQAFADLNAAAVTDNGTLIHTHCVYPSGVQVRVRITRAASGYRITDDAEGLAEILSIGVETKRPGYYLAMHAAKHGLRYDRGAVFVDIEDENRIAAAIMLVANASKDGVLHSSIAHQPNDKASFEFTFQSFVQQKHHGRFRPASVAGASGTVRRFKYVHQRNNQAEIVLDQPIVLVEPVSPTQIGISVKAASHRDLQMKKLPHLWQRLVVDRETDNWSRTDLAFLKQQGVPWIEFTALEQELPKQLAA